MFAERFLARHVGRFQGQPQRTAAGRSVPATHWGLTRAQLLEFRDACREDPQTPWDDSDNVRSFVLKFVRPRTAGTGMGIALSLNQAAPRRVDLMVSHSWEENAARFFEDVLAEMDEHEVAFICFLAIYQGTPLEIQAQLGPDASRAPFVQVIHQVFAMGGRMLVVPCEELRRNGEGLYSRMWCDFEIYTALNWGLKLKFAQGTTLEHLFGRGNLETFSSRRARCGDPSLERNSDEAAIRGTIEHTHVPSPAAKSALMVALNFLDRLALTLVAHVLWILWTRDGGQQPQFAHWRLVSLYFVAMGILHTIIELGTLRLLSTCGSRDGYEELDACIRRLAQFHRAFPDATLDSRFWGPVRMESCSVPVKKCLACCVLCSVCGSVSVWLFVNPARGVFWHLFWWWIGPPGSIALASSAHAARWLPQFMSDISAAAAPMMRGYGCCICVELVVFIVATMGITSIGCVFPEHFVLMLWLGFALSLPSYSTGIVHAWHQRGERYKSLPGWSEAGLSATSAASVLLSGS